MTADLSHDERSLRKTPRASAIWDIIARTILDTVLDAWKGSSLCNTEKTSGPTHY